MMFIDVYRKWEITSSTPSAPCQVSVHAGVTPDLVEAVSLHFAGARRSDVESILQSLAALGLVPALETPNGLRYRAARVAA